MSKGKTIAIGVSAGVIFAAVFVVLAIRGGVESESTGHEVNPKRMRALVARLANVKSREIGPPHMAFYRTKKDVTVIGEIKAKGKAIVPYLIEGLDSRDNTIRWQCSGMLASVVPSRAGLMALIGKLEARPTLPGRNSHDRAYLQMVGWDLNVLTGEACPGQMIPLGGSAEDFGRMRDFWLSWWDQNGPDVADTDYGVGLRYPDGTTRALGFHGKIAWYKHDGETVDFEGWYFCSHSTSETISEAEFMERHQARLGQKDWFPLVPHVGYIWSWPRVKLFERFYEDGKPHGRWREWDKEGQLTEEKHFVGGIEVTEEKYEASVAPRGEEEAAGANATHEVR